MKPEYKIDIAVTFPNGRVYPASIVVSAHAGHFFGWEPIDVCDRAVEAMVFGGKTKHQAKEIETKRRDLAREISEKLTNHILEGLKSQDTINGYPAG